MMYRGDRGNRYERLKHLQADDWRRDVDYTIDQHTIEHEELRQLIADVNSELRKIYFALLGLCMTVTTGIITGAIVALLT